MCILRTAICMLCCVAHLVRILRQPFGHLKAYSYREPFEGGLYQKRALENSELRMKLFTFEPTTPPAVILEARYWPLARRSYSGKKGIVDYCNVPRPVMKGALLSRSACYR